MESKYAKLHSILRYVAALLAIVVFISMFITKQAVNPNDSANDFYDFRSGAFFGDSLCKGNFLAFIGYLFVLLGGLAGLAFVFIDEIIGKDLTKKLAFVAGGVAVLGAVLVLLFAPLFIAMNGNGFNRLTTGAGPIVFGILGLAVGGMNIAAPILEEKGK